jgi:membrane protein YdbS with pleckstrin-like domain
LVEPSRRDTPPTSPSLDGPPPAGHSADAGAGSAPPPDRAAAEVLAPPPDPAPSGAAARGPQPGDVDLALWPGDVSWRRVSPKLLVVRRVGVAIGAVPWLVGAGVAALLTGDAWPAAAIALVGAALLAWWWRLVSRAVRAWGYAEREDDLLIRRGVLFRRLTVVPYGRIQFVDVRVGPIERSLGLATVQLHTAAAATDAYIPGLPADEAARLRDRLAALGQARAAGL